MTHRDERLVHAHIAIERTARCLSELRCDLNDKALGMSREQWLSVREAAADLQRRHMQLQELHLHVRLGPQRDLAATWHRFFCCYDECLEAARITRLELMRETCPNGSHDAAYSTSS